MSFALKSHSLDAFDFAILRILQENNRLALQEIGRSVNLSSAAVQRRVRRMCACIAAHVLSAPAVSPFM